MIWLFYISGAVAVVSALLVVTGTNTMRSLINLIVSFIAIAAVMWTLGAPFAAVLQIVVYAGAILILFIFVVMILNLGSASIRQERTLFGHFMWLLPAIMAAALLAMFIDVIMQERKWPSGSFVLPKAVGANLLTTYVIGIELASVLLLAGLVAAYHYGAFMNRQVAEDD